MIIQVSWCVSSSCNCVLMNGWLKSVCHLTHHRSVPFCIHGFIIKCIHLRTLGREYRSSKEAVSSAWPLIQAWKIHVLSYRSTEQKGWVERKLHACIYVVISTPHSILRLRQVSSTLSYREVKV